MRLGENLVSTPVKSFGQGREKWFLINRSNIDQVDAMLDGCVEHLNHLLFGAGKTAGSQADDADFFSSMGVKRGIAYPNLLKTIKNETSYEDRLII